jgi:hypothetical protein
MSNAPSPEAVAAGRDLAFEAIQETLDQATSFALSAREAAFRGNPATLAIHLRQLRLCTIDAIQIYKSLDELLPL